MIVPRSRAIVVSPDSEIADPHTGILIPEREFHVVYTDSHGHDARVQFRISKHVLTQLQLEFDTKDLPYALIHDMYRHALQRHIDWMVAVRAHRGNKPPIKSVMRAYREIEYVIQEEEMQAGFESKIKSMTKFIERYVREDQRDRAASMVERVLSAIATMPEGDWKRQWSDKIMRDFGHLLRGRVVDGSKVVDTEGNVED